MTGTSVARRPRGVVKINGLNADFFSFRVEQKVYFSADTWQVEMECWSQKQGFDIKFFAQSAGTEIEILLGFLTSGQRASQLPTAPTSLILGTVDDIDMSLGDGKLRLSGRDYSSKFIDTKTANKWPDQTASQIVATLARSVGLQANITTTKTPSGEYYTSDYSKVSRSTPMWDLIKFLAEQEGFDAYVSGRVLYFGPPIADQDKSPFQITIQRGTQGRIRSNARRIDLRRSETVAADLSVVVLSHGIHRGAAIRAVATRAGKTAGASTARKENTQSYVIRRPNLTQEQAQQLATSTLLDLTRRERAADVSMAGDITLSPRRRVRLSGTQTGFDLDYYVNSVSHEYSDTKGYEMQMSLKNHPTLSEVDTVS